jgi:hypothetical protein
LMQQFIIEQVAGMKIQFDEDQNQLGKEPV